MHEKLSQFHLAILVFMTQAGMVIFSLPRLLAQYFGTNGWLVVVLFAVVVSMNIALISAVYHLGKGRSVFDIMEQSIPRWMLFPFYFLILVSWAVIGCLVAKQYILLFQMIAFPTASPMLFKFLFDALLFLFITMGIYNISKAATVFLWLMGWITLLLFYFYEDSQWERLTPFIFQDSHFSMEGFIGVYSAFLGYELFILVFPYVDKKTKVSRAILYGHLIVTLHYLYLGLIAFGTYGHTYLSTLQFPLLSIFAYIQFPFIQGAEILFYTFFMFSIITTAGMYFWASAEVGKQMFPVNMKLLVFIILFAAFCITYPVDTMNEITSVLTNLSYLQLVTAILFPIGLILLLLIQRTRGE